MIWFRRILTIPLIIIFIVFFIIVLLVTQVNDTFGNPGFYNDQLKQADMYNFLYDEVMPLALDEIETDASSDVPIDIPAIKDEAVSTARAILPPEWLEEQVESGINAILPWVLGDTDEFTYTLALKDRVERAAEVIKQDTLHSDMFTSLYDDGVAYLAEQLVENLDKMPYPLALSKERIEESLKTVAPEDWIVVQVEAAINSVLPYATGDANHFTITIPMEDRIDAVAAAFTDLVGGQETYDYLLDEMITPILAANLGAIVNLPFEVSFTQEEIASAIRQVLPQAWVQARLEEVINGIAAYVKGDADSIGVIVDLGERKAEALSVITGLADEKLQAMFNSLPTCSMAEFLLAVQSLPPGGIPDCRPAGVSYEDFKTTLHIDIAEYIDQMIGDQIPNQWVYTDADLKRSFGEGNEGVLDDARNWVSDGWTYTDADLLNQLDNNGEQKLNDAREWVASGYPLTETDLRDAIADADADIEPIDDARSWTGTARTWLWTLWIVPFLYLLFIGLLGGRNWSSRLYWGLVPLFLISLALYVTIAVAYPSVGEPRLEEAVPDPLEYEAFVATMVEKGNEAIHNVVGTFLSGIQDKTLFMMIGSSVVLLGIIAWSVIGSRQEPEINSAPESGETST